MSLNDAVLGVLQFVEAECGFASKPLAVRFLNGKPCRLVLQIPPDVAIPADIRAAALNALATGPEVFNQAEQAVTQYRFDALLRSGLPPAPLEERSQIWKHVRFGETLTVTRRSAGDSEDGVYVSLECGCDWEREHGLQIVLRDGLRVTKLGPYDGHLTNSDAYDDPTLAGVLYRRLPS